MSAVSENNKRIAKNTLLLYARMLFMMLISLYTSRKFLEFLGVEDFGLYNVVGGIVVLFSFLNSSMTSSTQRFMSYELGQNNNKGLKVIFSSSLLIYILFSIIFVIIIELLGSWLINNKLTIPNNRLDSVFFVFHLSVLSSAFSLYSIPYTSILIANEDMNVYAYVSVLESALKLLIVYLLEISPFDKLQAYSFYFFLVTIVIQMIYIFYCNKRYRNMIAYFLFDKKVVIRMMNFAWWNVLGNIAYISYTQGINMLLNIFFGPTVNAARAVAVQVDGMVSKFYSNFQMAVNPQIIKYYSEKKLDEMHNLMINSSRITLFLMITFSVPIIIGAEVLLNLWLYDVPEYSPDFLRLIILMSVVNSLGSPFNTAINATGNIRFYQITVSIILILTLPSSYILLKKSIINPNIVFIVNLLFCIAAQVVRVFIAKAKVQFPIKKYVEKCILPFLIIGITTYTINYILYWVMNNSILSFFVVAISSILMIIILSYFIALNVSERNVMKQRIYKFIKK